MRVDSLYTHSSYFINRSVRQFEISTSLQTLLTAGECNYIIDYGSSLQDTEGKIGGAKNKIDETIRKSKVVFLNSADKELSWLYQRLGEAVNDVNREYWQYDLDFIEVLQFTKYDEEGDCYGPHIDIGGEGFAQRKLSFSVQLSAGHEYEGGDLKIMSGHERGEIAGRNRGDAIFFPSFMMHEVTPIKKGKRYSLVGWVCGKNFR